MQAGEAVVSKDTSDKLNQFASTVWANPRDIFRRHADPEGFEYIDLGEYRDAFVSFFGPAIPFKILVREEYRIALQELQTHTYNRGGYVTGQPGIGKSLFLVYLLVELLGQKHRVALHDLDHQFYAIFTDTVCFCPLFDSGALVFGAPIWALSDSNHGNGGHPPCSFTCSPDDIRLIQATFPEKKRWHEWSKRSMAECYVMDIWTEQEIANLAKLLGFDVQRMVGLHMKWGGAPGTLLEYVDMQDQDVEALYRRSARLAVETCDTMTTSITMNRLPKGALTQFYFSRPYHFFKPSIDIDRTFTCAVVPTPTICHFLAKALQQPYSSVKLNFFDALSLPSGTREVARYIYECWFHCFFSAGKSIDCHWPRHCAAGVTSLCGTTTLISARSDELKDVKKLPYYWVAPPKFPGIDSALMCHDAIFAFQVTIRSKYKPPREGLEKLRDDLPPNLKNLPWHLVFVGNTDWPIGTAVKEWAGKIFLPTSQGCVSVGWSQVDPVEEGIAYRIIREKTYQELMGHYDHDDD